MLDERRHAGQPVGAAPPGGAHGDRLRLVVGMMRHQQVQDAVAGGRPRTAAGSAARAPPAAARSPASPDQRRISPAMPMPPSRSSGRRGPRPPDSAAGHGRRSAPAPAPAAPPPSHAPAAPAPANRARPKRRRQATGGASNGANGAISARELGVGARARPLRHPQPFFWRSWSMRRFCRSVARG